MAIWLAPDQAGHASSPQLPRDFVVPPTTQLSLYLFRRHLGLATSNHSNFQVLSQLTNHCLISSEAVLHFFGHQDFALYSFLAKEMTYEYPLIMICFLVFVELVSESMTLITF